MTDQRPASPSSPPSKSADDARFNLAQQVANAAGVIGRLEGSRQQGYDSAKAQGFGNTWGVSEYDHINLVGAPTRPGRFASPQTRQYDEVARRWSGVVANAQGGSPDSILKTHFPQIGDPLEVRQEKARKRAEVQQALTPPPMQSYSRYFPNAAVNTMAERLSQAEGTGEDMVKSSGVLSRYQIVYGHNKRFKSAKPVTDMSVDEILALQQAGNIYPGHTPVGKYQITQDNLSFLKNKLKLRGDELTSPDLQDRFFFELLRKRGYDAYVAGRISPEQYQRNLSQEWASIPVPGTERSIDPSQRTGISDAEMKALILGIPRNASAKK